MMTTLQAAILLSGSVVVFLSYQIIPASYERLAFRPEGAKGFLTIMQSQIGRLFIRYCGIDHLVMALVMAGPALGLVKPSSTAIWVVCASEWIVAIVSFLSAVAIRKEAKK